MRKNRRKFEWYIGFILAVIFLAAIILIEGIDYVSHRISFGYINNSGNEEIRSIYYSADDFFAEQEHSERPDVIDEDEKLNRITLNDAYEEENNIDKTDEYIFQDHFSELKSVNEHIAGWLQAGDNINEPVVLFDNSYYLEHDFYGNYSADGTLFINMLNNICPKDDVLLIHGHNMASGAKFGHLMRYESYDYLKKYPVIMFRTIYDPKEVYYVPIAAFNASMEVTDPEYFNIMRLAFNNEPDGTVINPETKRQSGEYEEYIASLKEWSIWKSPVNMNTDDKLLMLVTCSYYHNNGRFMLICRELRNGETPESISLLFNK